MLFIINTACCMHSHFFVRHPGSILVVDAYTRGLNVLMVMHWCVLCTSQAVMSAWWGVQEAKRNSTYHSNFEGCPQPHVNTSLESHDTPESHAPSSAGHALSTIFSPGHCASRRVQRERRFTPQRCRLQLLPRYAPRPHGSRRLESARIGRLTRHIMYSRTING